jgi:hypothetical protein
VVSGGWKGAAAQAKSVRKGGEKGGVKVATALNGADGGSKAASAHT